MTTYQELKSVACLDQIISFVIDELGIRLEPVGKNRYRSRCPFHTEGSPSFNVYVNAVGVVRFHCFGACGTHCDVYELIMKKRRCSIGEARQALARYVGDAPLQAVIGGPGVAIPPAAENPVVPVVITEPVALDPGISAALETAANFYNHLLLNNPDKYPAVIKYLYRRGVNLDAVARFGIGYAPAYSDEQYEGRALLLGNLDKFKDDHLTFRNYTKAGLFRLLNDETSPYRRYVDFREEWGIFGGYGDYLAGRMTFPIRNAQGQAQGFVGRRLDNRGIRWMKQQTDGTAIHAQGWLYGLDKFPGQQVGPETVIIVEGIFDYFAFYNILQDKGKPCIVSTMGSNLTVEALAPLKGLGIKHYIIAYDWDAAGRKGIDHAAKELGGTVYYLGGLQEGEDPAEKLKGVAHAISSFSMTHLIASAKQHQSKTAKPILISHITTGKRDQREIVLKPVTAIDTETIKPAKQPEHRYFNAEDFTPLLRYDHGNKASLDATIQALTKLLNSPPVELAGQTFRIKTDFIGNEFYDDLGPALILWLAIAIEQQRLKRHVSKTDTDLAAWLKTSRKTISSYKTMLKSLGYLNQDASGKTQKLSVSLVPTSPQH